MPENLKKTIACKKCQASFNVDYSKAPTDVFTLACPKCGQKYQLRKPGTAPASQAETTPQSIPNAQVATGGPKIPEKPTTSTTLDIDLKRFDPRSGWQYNLYRFTRSVPYVSHATLAMYGSKLVSSISTLVKEQAMNGQITPAAYAALKANMTATCSTIYSNAIAPELTELGIPRFMQKPFAASFTKSLASELSTSLVGLAANNATGASIRPSAPPAPSGTSINPEERVESHGSKSDRPPLRSAPEPKSSIAEPDSPALPQVKGPTPLEHGSTPPQAPPPESIQPNSALIARRPVPIAMWILGSLMLIACFLPWIEMRGSWDFGVGGRGSMLMGEASGTTFWQGQLGLLLLIGALVAKQLRQRAISGIIAVLVPLLAIHFVLQVEGALGHSSSASFMGYSASTSLRADPGVGSIAIVLLSIPFVILAFAGRKPKKAPVVARSVAAPPRPQIQVPQVEPTVVHAKPVVEPTAVQDGRIRMKPVVAIFGGLVILGMAIYGGIELSKRHSLTSDERAQAESWFADLRNGQWVLMPRTGPVRQDYALEYEPVNVSTDKYGMTTIRAHVVLRSIASGTTTRYGTMEERSYTNLSEPEELWLANDNDTPGEGTSIVLRRITTDSVEVEFRDEEGTWEVFAGVPEHRFNVLRSSADARQRRALVTTLDSIAQGTGLVRRGVFDSYACGEECGATFVESRSGGVVPITYVCNNNRFGDIQLSQGDMLGTGDFTNKALIGKRFLIVSKLVSLPDHDGVPVWAVQGLLPDVEGESFPELDQRIALSANFDAGVGMTPVVSPSSDAIPNTTVSFLDDSDIHEAKDLHQQPEFPGGMDKMYEFTARIMKYPDAENDAGIQGKVYVQFTVAKDGSIRDAKVLRSVSEGLDREALRIVRSMPPWRPGQLDGVPVNCRFNLPINFRLQ